MNVCGHSTDFVAAIIIATMCVVPSIVKAVDDLLPVDSISISSVGARTTNETRSNKVTIINSRPTSTVAASRSLLSTSVCIDAANLSKETRSQVEIAGHASLIKRLRQVIPTQCVPKQYRKRSSRFWVLVSSSGALSSIRSLASSGSLAFDETGLDRVRTLEFLPSNSPGPERLNDDSPGAVVTFYDFVPPAPLPGSTFRQD